MSSRNKKNLLQLSVATLFLFQFFLMFSPSVASGFLNSIRFESSPNARVRYELKITAVDNQPLSQPLLVSQVWNDLGIEEYGKAQILIDDLARALSQNNFEKAREIHAELATDHFQDFDDFEFEVQRIKVIRAPIKTNAYHMNRQVEDYWSSDLLKAEEATK